MNRPGVTSMYPSSQRLLLPPWGGPPPSWRLSSRLRCPGQASAPRKQCWCVSPPLPRALGAHHPAGSGVTSSRDPASPCVCLPRPPCTPRARLGLQVSSRGGCLLSGSTWGRLGDLDTPRCPGLGLWLPLELRLRFVMKVCSGLHSRGGPASLPDRAAPGAGCGPQGVVTARGDGLSSSLGSVMLALARQMALRGLEWDVGMRQGPGCGGVGAQTGRAALGEAGWSGAGGRSGM